MPSSNDRRDDIARSARPTPKGVRLDLSIYVYADGSGWVQSPNMPSGSGYSRSLLEKIKEDVGLMLDQAHDTMVRRDAA